MKSWRRQRSSDSHLKTIAAGARRLGAALTALPPEQRFEIELAFFGGLTHDQIAARTGVPLGTAKGRVRLGPRRLRRDLQDLASPSTGTRPAHMRTA